VKKRAQQIYREVLTETLWGYAEKKFRGLEELFEKTREENPKRPPVFLRELGHNNVLLSKTAGGALRNQVLNQIPKEKWHKWFSSMMSSQALAQSVFGNLKALGKLTCLWGLIGDDRKPLFIRIRDNFDKFEMEKNIDYLGERRMTSVDVFFGGEYQIAVECKLSEPEVGTCSRPRLLRTDPTYEREYCDGRYAIQGERGKRCALTELGIRYWDNAYIPRFFKADQWSPDEDHSPCPMKKTYQLVRNILAAGLSSAPRHGNGEIVHETGGHVVLLYDARNPEFQKEGEGTSAYNEVKNGLLNKSLLQKCTWQQVIVAMKADPELAWLVEALGEKYGLVPESEAYDGNNSHGPDQISGSRWARSQMGKAISRDCFR